MEVDTTYFNERKEKAWTIYNTQRSIYNPYLKNQIVFNSDGFHHLQFSARRERNKREQLLKFSLLPLAIEYWAFIAIVGKNNQIKIRTVLRRVGDGNITFWSVMPDSKFKKEQGQKLFSEGIEDA